jgi:hypothetical protein
MKPLELTGRPFGRLIVRGRAPNINGRTAWYCDCECGNKPIILGKSMVNENILSCGCLKKEINQRKARKMSENNMLPVGESALNLLYATYEWRATDRNLSFNLSLEEFRNLTKGNCHYCGKEPAQKFGMKTLRASYIYNGVDRVNNDFGYSIDNCVSCCKVCNRMKGKKTVAEFVAFCSAISDLQKKRAEELLRLSLPRIVSA